jgi:hypothetical protein
MTQRNVRVWIVNAPSVVLVLRPLTAPSLER